MASDPKLVAIAARADVFEVDSDKRLLYLASFLL